GDGLHHRRHRLVLRGQRDLLPLVEPRRRGSGVERRARDLRAVAADLDEHVPRLDLARLRRLGHLAGGRRLDDEPIEGGGGLLDHAFFFLDLALGQADLVLVVRLFRLGEHLRVVLAALLPFEQLGLFLLGALVLGDGGAGLDGGALLGDPDDRPFGGGPDLPAARGVPAAQRPEARPLPRRPLPPWPPPPPPPPLPP